MLKRLKTASKMAGGNGPDTSPPDKNVSWNRRTGRNSGMKKANEIDQFRVHQQAFYVRGDVIVDVHQARGIRPASAGDRNTYCVVLVDGERVGETTVCPRAQTPVWNQPLRVSHETIRQAADRNVWPVPFQPLTIQLWERGSASDALLGSARVPISNSLKPEVGDGWRRLVGTGDQATGDGEPVGKIRVIVHWESKAFASSPKDEARLFLRDVLVPEEKDYQHLYYGMHMSTFLAPPAGEEILLEMMSGISRHDPTAGGYGKGVEGMLVLTELRLLFLPDISSGSATAPFLEFHTVQVYLAAVRSFSHRGLEGGSRLLSISTRDGRSVHFRMPAFASVARCGAWYDAECSRRRLSRMPGSGGEELWRRGLWGAGSSEQWMERLVDEIRWRKAQGNFVSLWYKLVETTISLRNPENFAPSLEAAAEAGSVAGGGEMRGRACNTACQYASTLLTGSNGGNGGMDIGHSGIRGRNSKLRGDTADGWAALERDLERVGVQAAVTSSYVAYGRQNWEIKTINKGYNLVPTYPKTLAFPSSITPAQLTAAAPQRSRNRLPALVWLHPASKAPLVRSSQPMAGMTTKVLSEDIYLLKQIRVTLDATKISIVDARSLLNAKANQVTGKGFEDVADIGRDVATLGFMGIDNIHAVRDSLAALSAASHAQGQEYFQAVGASGWLRHLAQIMKGAAFVVDELQKGVAVLVHCSDGWDRTSQLTALAQLYLDPYYRTLEGFEVLVEKEWGSFGHMFGLRAHSDSPTESSPVFLQWLDAVWQLVRQHPASFEFTGHYLERLVEGLYSAAFLNFAGNCERERKEKLKELREAGSGGVSIFTYLRHHATEGHLTAPLINPLYRPRASKNHGVGGGIGALSPLREIDLLRPCCESQGLEIWQAVYMRDSLLLHHRERQLSVEQGLRLQVYDLTRRIDLVESYVNRLPRSLVSQLVSSATGIESSEWDSHLRLVDQVSSDREAKAAAAAAQVSVGGTGPNTGVSAPSYTSRGRSQQRATRAGGNMRSNDDGSRSRSRSFNLPLRGWGAGKSAAERRQRWGSQDSMRDTDIEEDPEIGTHTNGSGSIQSGSGSGSIGTGVSAGVGSVDLEEEMERTGRSRSFFLFPGRRGNRRRLPAPPSIGEGGNGREEENSPEQEDNAGARGVSRKWGGRRRAGPAAGAGSGDRASYGVALSASASAPDAGGGSVRVSAATAGGAAAAPVNSNTAHVRRRSGRMGITRSNSLDAFAEEGSTRSRQASHLEAVHRRLTTGQEDPEINEDLLRRQRAQSVATMAGRKEGEARSLVGYTGRDDAPKGSRWMFSRRRRSSAQTTTSTVGSSEKEGRMREKGSLQQSIGTKTQSSPYVLGPLKRTASANRRFTVGDQAAHGAGRPGMFTRPASSSSDNRASDTSDSLTTEIEGQKRNDKEELSEAEAEARRKMLHTIATLEVQLLIKDVVDEACLQAARRPHDLALSLKFTPPSSSGPASQPSLSTVTTSERPAFFGGLWSGSDRQRRHSTAGVGEEHKRELPSKTASARELISAEASRVIGPVFSGSSSDVNSVGGSRNSDAFSRKGENEQEEEVGFFEALRRKLFEGQDGLSTTLAQAVPAAAPVAAPVAAPAASTAAVRVPAPAAVSGPAPVSTVVAPVKEAGGDLFGMRTTSVTAGSRVYHGHKPRKAWQVQEPKVNLGQSYTPPQTTTTSTSPAGQAAAALARASALPPIPSESGSRADTTSNPDAGAGRDRSADLVEVVASDLAAETAAKFGLVRMVFGE